MTPRNKRLEQAKPKEDTPAKVAKRNETDRTPGKFKLPKGKIAQHKAKPGMTSPQ
jgi:hypothetical protein